MKSKSPKEITRVIKNTIPEKYGNVILEPIWCYSIAFFKVNEIKYIFQSSPCLKIQRNDTKDVLFEFRTITNISFNKPKEDDKLIALSFDFFKSAVEGFNGHIKDLTSYLTLSKSYPEPKIENTIEAIRTAYLNCLPYVNLSRN